MGIFDFIFGNKRKEEEMRLERERQAELQRKENERRGGFKRIENGGALAALSVELRHGGLCARASND